jgi:hypothetical protein
MDVPTDLITAVKSLKWHILKENPNAESLLQHAK